MYEYQVIMVILKNLYEKCKIYAIFANHTITSQFINLKI